MLDNAPSELRPGGPPALRTPDYLQGKPDLTGDQLLKVQESNMMLERCVQCLRLVNSAGGHSHLEQPHTAMSWQEPVVQQYIEQQSCSCVCIAACCYGKDWLKTWMLAATYSAVSQLACACTHPRGSHQQIAGAISSSGQFLSRDTAEYPAQLAAEFGGINYIYIYTPFGLKNSQTFIPLISKLGTGGSSTSHLHPPCAQLKMGSPQSGHGNMGNCLVVTGT